MSMSQESVILGLSKFADVSTASFGSCHTGNARWLPPELLQDCSARVTYEGDIYAYGCVWLEVKLSYVADGPLELINYLLRYIL